MEASSRVLTWPPQGCPSRLVSPACLCLSCLPGLPSLNEFLKCCFHQLALLNQTWQRTSRCFRLSLQRHDALVSLSSPMSPPPHPQAFCVTMPAPCPPLLWLWSHLCCSAYAKASDPSRSNLTCEAASDPHSCSSETWLRLLTLRSTSICSFFAVTKALVCATNLGSYVMTDVCYCLLLLSVSQE